MKEDYVALVREAGFMDVGVLQEKGYSVDGCEGKVKVVSITVRGIKPQARCDGQNGGSR
jgi:hypothetical protein